MALFEVWHCPHCDRPFDLYVLWKEHSSTCDQIQAFRQEPK